MTNGRPDDREVEDLSRVETRGEADAAAGQPVDAKISAPVGAAGGAVAGAAVGTIVLGPLGTAIGAIAGAVGGGWLGFAEGKPDQPRYRYQHDDDAAYRQHYDSTVGGSSAHTYDAARPAYALGHVAAQVPDYAGKDFETVEADLRRGWTPEVSGPIGSWDAARAYARAGYERATTARDRGETFADPNLGGTVTHQRASFSDPAPKYENAVSAADTVGANAPGSDPVPVAGKPEWMERPVDQGGFGARPSTGTADESRT